jgi:hypothetical protein
MNRVEIFTFRLNKDERLAIADLAARLQRSQSDAVRFVVIEAARQLSQADPAPVIFLPIKVQEIKHGRKLTPAHLSMSGGKE